ncbi:hypothetical protein [Spirosoma rigui]|uniref:hypothetical protein n=1 Tax=Spirosoma rigui TaxID=564064 RepID=UPI0009B0035D|nr:hypothetical protein [Spirosoma rigui]
MYQTLLIIHSLVRWLVLVTLVYALVNACIGYSRKRPFTKADDAVRHWTATTAHIQLILGATLYFNSPVISAFFARFSTSIQSASTAFFGIIHALTMFVAILIITIGSALAKRQTVDRDKFRTLLIWFSIGLVLILLAIPWPFSPLANRPYVRSF